MSVEASLRAAMIADAGVAGKIAARLYLGQIPQNPTYPCAAYQRISTQRLYAHMLGGQQGAFGWSRFQFTSFGAGPTGGADAEATSAALRAALQTFNLAAVAASPQVLLQAPNFVLNELMHIEAQPEQPIFKFILDVKVWFNDLS